MSPEDVPATAGLGEALAARLAELGLVPPPAGAVLPLRAEARPAPDRDEDTAAAA